MRGNLHRPYGFGRNGAVFGVAPPHNVEALVPRRSPKSGTVALRNLATLSLAGTTSSPRRNLRWQAACLLPAPPSPLSFSTSTPRFHRSDFAYNIG